MQISDGNKSDQAVDQSQGRAAHGRAYGPPSQTIDLFRHTYGEDVGQAISGIDGDQDQNPVAEGDDDQLRQNQPIQDFQLTGSKPKDNRQAERNDGAC